MDRGRFSPRVQQIKKKLGDLARENKKPEDRCKLIVDKLVNKTMYCVDSLSNQVHALPKADSPDTAH